MTSSLTTETQAATFPLTHKADQFLINCAQGAFFNETILPSGIVTPACRMKLVGNELVAVKGAGRSEARL